jgi:hypothetical protein
MFALPTLIPLSEAARKYGMEEDYLRTLIEKGKIRAGVIAGEMVVSEEEVQKRAEQEQGSGVKKEDLPEYSEFKHLEGIPISISEAEGKYGVPNPTIVRWVQRGFIRVIGTEGRKKLINERDIAYCANVYKKNQGQGKWIFSKNGTPYVRGKSLSLRSKEQITRKIF